MTTAPTHKISPRIHLALSAINLDAPSKGSIIDLDTLNDLAGKTTADNGRVISACVYQLDECLMFTTHF